MNGHKYNIILNEIGHTVGADTVDGRALLNFMFNTRKVTSEVANKSEDLLTELMNDGREWFWIELDSPESSESSDGKMIGASGYFDQVPFDCIVSRLTKIHKIWMNHGCTTVHPLQPILEAWVDSGGEKVKANKEVASQGATVREDS